MNHIETIRTDILKVFGEHALKKAEAETFFSPSKKYRLDATNYWLKDPRWDITKAEIYDEITNEKIFGFFINDSQFYFGWLSAGEVDYLACAENIFGGQTIVDLTNRKMNGYSPGEDGFIWTDFHLSPDGKTLATIGCYWASSFVIKLFDFSEPLNLPLKEIKEIELLANDEIIIGWLDNETLQMKGIKSELEPEYFEDGSMRMKTISEVNVERQINIMS